MAEVGQGVIVVWEVGRVAEAGLLQAGIDEQMKVRIVVEATVGRSAETSNPSLR